MISQARHLTDLAFWFGTVGRFPLEFAMADHAPYALEAAGELSAAMVGMLAAFAKNGNPSTDEFEFPAFKSAGEADSVRRTCICTRMHCVMPCRRRSAFYRALAHTTRHR